MQLALELAGAASEKTRVAFAQRDHRWYEKSANDFATDTDTAIEEHIASRIAAAFSGDTLLEEEGGERLLGNAATTDVRWIVDPLDSTFNFIRGFPYVATSIAIEAAGDIKFGLIDAPLQREFFSAGKDLGTRLHARGKAPVKLVISSCVALSKTLVGSVLPSATNASLARVLLAWTRIASHCGSVRRTGVAVLD